jgi:hypothetical protein
MPYGGFGSFSAGVDLSGYQAVTASGSPIIVLDTTTGATEVELYTSTLAAHTTDTLFIYGYPNGGITNVAFLQCPDAVWQLGGIFPCSFGNGG